MEVTSNTVVSLNLTVRRNEDEVLESTSPGRPLNYLHGYGNIVPGLEEALDGAEPGYQATIVVEPALAFGEAHEPTRITVEKDQVSLPRGGSLEPGLVVMSEAANETFPLTVVEVGPRQLVVEGVHPLAGQWLEFEVEVVAVREATIEERYWGHPLPEGRRRTPDRAGQAGTEVAAADSGRPTPWEARLPKWEVEGPGLWESITRWVDNYWRTSKKDSTTDKARLGW